MTVVQSTILVHSLIKKLNNCTLIRNSIYLVSICKLNYWCPYASSPKSVCPHTHARARARYYTCFTSYLYTKSRLKLNIIIFTALIHAVRALECLALIAFVVCLAVEFRQDFRKVVPFPEENKAVEILAFLAGKNTVSNLLEINEINI